VTRRKFAGAGCWRSRTVGHEQGSHKPLFCTKFQSPSPLLGSSIPSTVFSTTLERTGSHFAIYCSRTSSSARGPTSRPEPANSSPATLFTYLHTLIHTKSTQFLHMPPTSDEQMAARDGHDIQECENMLCSENDKRGRGCCVRCWKGGGGGGRRCRWVVVGDGAEGAGLGGIVGGLGHREGMDMQGVYYEMYWTAERAL
jgi:hypothetical protein